MASKNNDIEAFLQPLVVDDERLYGLAVEFSKTYRQLAWDSSEQFIPTPLTTLPSGEEKGQFLAIDVGGTNLRVGFIELVGDDIVSDGSNSKEHSIHDGPEEPGEHNGTTRIRRRFEKAWPIGEHLKVDKAEDLFAWIGDCMAEVVRDRAASTAAAAGPQYDVAREEEEEELDMGITFSFPMIQSSLSEATLMPMGKGFAITSNLNLGKLLLAGYERHTKDPIMVSTSGPSMTIKKLPRLRIAAITNDTVATLASLSYTATTTRKSKMLSPIPNTRVAMGLIVGTGTNATIPIPPSYLSPSKRSLIHGSSSPSVEDSVVVNTEWSLPGTLPPLQRYSLVTAWDLALDAASDSPGFQPLEYMTSGRYLGELVRLIVVDLLLTFSLAPSLADLPFRLRQRNGVSTTFLATVIAAPNTSIVDLVDTLNETLSASAGNGGSRWKWTADSARWFRRVAELVQRRSARLIAAASVGLLGCAGECTLGFHDGSGFSPTGSSMGTESSVFASPATNPAGTNAVVEPIETETEAEGKKEEEEEVLIIAYTGTTITSYPSFLSTCQAALDVLTTLSQTSHPSPPHHPHPSDSPHRDEPPSGIPDTAERQRQPQPSAQTQPKTRKPTTKKIVLRETRDGGIVGAGVLAGVALRRASAA
ncbi:MAG: hypothetical protein M1819_001290 [Sarea resinae]|nr:MAG: hypothetical protein M1819_001290 [Sarea resinae]